MPEQSKILGNLCLEFSLKIFTKVNDTISFETKFQVFLVFYYK